MRLLVAAAAALCVSVWLIGAPARAFDPVVVMHSDFEDGTAQGWFGRGAASLAVTTDAAHAGTQSLRTSGRSATWNGPAETCWGCRKRARPT